MPKMSQNNNDKKEDTYVGVHALLQSLKILKPADVDSEIEISHFNFHCVKVQTKLKMRACKYGGGGNKH